MSANKHYDDSHKEQFQLERLVLFSDAVFAIAITLLIIEVKVPEVHSEHVTDGELWHSLSAVIPKFAGFLVSFYVIGLYWLVHHRLFRYVTRSNQKLLWANLIFLMPIVVMPFSTAFLSEYYNGTLRLPLAVYALNISLTGFFCYRLWKIVGNPKFQLSTNLNKIVLRYNTARALIIPSLFILVLLLSFIRPWISYLVIPVIPLITRFIKRHYIKKYPDVMKSHLE